MERNTSDIKLTLYSCGYFYYYKRSHLTKSLMHLLYSPFPWRPLQGLYHVPSSSRSHLLMTPWVSILTAYYTAMCGLYTPCVHWIPARGQVCAVRRPPSPPYPAALPSPLVGIVD